MGIFDRILGPPTNEKFGRLDMAAAKRGAPGTKASWAILFAAMFVLAPFHARGADNAIADAEQRSRPPNIVFILADDLGYNDLSCYGRHEHHTPHLDKLAAEGMRFSSAYCAQPICSPTRAAILTGRSPARLQLTTYLPGRPDAPTQKLLHPKMRMELPLEEQTIAELLKSNGYATACIGKWHLGGDRFGPERQGFDVVYPGNAATKPSETEGGKGEFDLTRHSIAFVEEHRERPFFLYLAHNTPHIPLAAGPELVAQYSDTFNPTYAAMIHTLDETVGQLLGRLDQLDLARQTIVVFTSDNGGLHVLESPESPATHNSPLRAGKGFVYEGGLRIPLIVRWPGHVPAGKIVDTPVISTDWLPTLAEACGLPAPDKLDGMSLLPLLKGGDLASRPLFWHFPHYTNQGSRPAGAMRDGPWKLIEHYEDGRRELFNLADDLGETRDESGRQPERVTEMAGRLDAWRRSVGTQTNVINPDFDEGLHRQLYEDIDISQLRPAATAEQMRGALAGWRKAMNDAIRTR